MLCIASALKRIRVRRAPQNACNCEATEQLQQKFYIRRPNKRDKTGRDRTKANTLAANAKSYAELLRAKNYRTKWAIDF